ncbi:MAG: glycosyltransferase family 2 protein [Actinobacteria bacterium]|nr:MAG: glycosyltransferase family 2 protein [Actinomycetota bacterium]
MASKVDILIATYQRPAALAVTLTGLCAQSFDPFRVVISDQSEDGDPLSAGEVLAPSRLLRSRGHDVRTHRRPHRRGIAEHRSFLLSRAEAPYVLFLDDDVILEPDLLERLVGAIERERCGFVASAVIGLSHMEDERPHEQAIEFWEGPVGPERIAPGSPEWERYRLHNAANLYHVQRDLGLSRENERLYKLAWAGGCVLYDTKKLRAVGGFDFWRDLPPDHAGEDVLAQWRVMASFGGCGLIPSGAYHQELPTTIDSRRVDAPRVLPVEEDPRMWKAA